MIQRVQSSKILELASKFKVISITGPRQSGKTVLAKTCFPAYEYYNLEDPSIRELISQDPKKFVNHDKKGVIFDEVQKLPDLLSYMQVVVDETDRPAQFVITGSENLTLSQKVSQTLAGRVAIFNLLPLSISELQAVNLATFDPFKLLLRGFYPGIFDKNIATQDFYSNYLATYVERDVRSIKNIGDVANFQKFMQLLSGRVGQLFNASSMASDLGIDSKTINSWLSVLETCFIVFRLQPYFQNFGKRAIKSPKVYFYDTGLLGYLLGIGSSEELDRHFARGALFENLIIAEMYKHKFNNLLSDKYYFWRDSNGNELDLILDRGASIDAVEIKSAGTFKTEFTKGFDYWESLPVPNRGDNFLIYTGNTEGKINNYHVLNWQDLSTISFRS